MGRRKRTVVARADDPAVTPSVLVGQTRHGDVDVWREPLAAAPAPEADDPEAKSPGLPVFALGTPLTEIACVAACPAVVVQAAKIGPNGMTEPARDGRSRVHSFRVGCEGVTRIVSDASHVHVYGSHGYIRTPHANVAWDRPA